jgi:uncharacterized protein YndB with AHSA1/START domain
MVEKKMSIETSDRELVISRTFNAPRALVFEAFAECRHLKHWWGPRQWPLASCEMDFREGGEWSYCMKGPEGQLACSKAIFQEIRIPHRIVYQDFFLDENGKVNPDLPSGWVTFEFVEVDGTTKMAGRTRYMHASDLQTVLDMGMIEGMSETLDRLEEYLGKILDNV